jgi:hypothetical protein
MAEGLYGLLAEFGTVEQIQAAADRTRNAGYRCAEAYTPFPIPGLAQRLGAGRSPVPLIALIGAITGGVTGFGMCWYANVISYPWNVGGRPLNSWPAWIPITFELTVLFCALSAVGGMFLINGLPRLHHPIFNAEIFVRSTRDRFFLCIESADGQFDPAGTRSFLESLNPMSISEVPE